MTPSLFQEAYEAFHARLPQMLAEGLHGRWVLFHGELMVEVCESRDRLYELATKHGWEEEEIFVDMIAPASEDIDADSLRFR
jgi:hypothetical protein